jgi:Tol biopolymer transport system component
MKPTKVISTLACAGFLVTLLPVSGEATELGIFSDEGDVGRGLKPGSVEFDSAKGTYLVGGGGGNMWFTNDAFHFVWKKMSGDMTLAASIAWIGASSQPHRKACLIVRQSLDANSPYADAVVHGNGLTSLQYRETTNCLTREIQSNVTGPARLRIEKHGDYVSLSIASAGETLHAAGGSFRIHFTEPFYVGLGICAHDDNALEKAIFSKVDLASLPPIPADAKPAIESTLEIIPVGSMDRRVVYHTSQHIEAPNWSRDGLYFLYNSNGRIYKMLLAGGEPQPVDTGAALHSNNDHGISPDGRLLAISDRSAADGKSRIYVLPITGGMPQRITPEAPSYWHGWSPDGQTLVYCGERNGEFDIYTIPAEGGQEKRLTTAPGLDDGPDYSPDGRYIYFNSERTGLMQIWRMRADGSEQQQVTSDGYNNWFAHPSPDGRWIVFLSFPKDVKGHPANKDVMLRLMPTRGGQIQVLAKLFGGQGTINVPSWSPDSQRLAFVSYQPVYP